MGAADAYMLGHAKIGTAIRRAGLFEAAGVPFMLQNVGGNITRALTVHLQAAFPTGSFHFFSDTETWKSDVVKERLDPINGFIRVPERLFLETCRSRRRGRRRPAVATLSAVRPVPNVGDFHYPNSGNPISPRRDVLFESQAGHLPPTGSQVKQRSGGLPASAAEHLAAFVAPVDDCIVRVTAIWALPILCHVAHLLANTLSVWCRHFLVSARIS